jgi:uncharacterized protein (TIGR00369 family)
MTFLSPDVLNDFMRRAFPGSDNHPRVIASSENSVRVILPFDPSQIRPGGTLSGPTQMMLADSAMYLLVVSRTGLDALAVTTHLSIDFLRKPAAADLIADVDLVKYGKRLMVGRVTISSANFAEPVAIASVTYSRSEPKND